MFEHLKLDLDSPMFFDFGSEDEEDGGKRIKSFIEFGSRQFLSPSPIDNIIVHGEKVAILFHANHSTSLQPSLICFRVDGRILWRPEILFEEKEELSPYEVYLGQKGNYHNIFLEGDNLKCYSSPMKVVIDFETGKILSHEQYDR